MPPVEPDPAMQRCPAGFAFEFDFLSGSEGDDGDALTLSPGHAVAVVQSARQEYDGSIQRALNGGSAAASFLSAAATT